MARFEDSLTRFKDSLASLQHQQARKEVQRSAYFILSTSNTTSEQIVA
ncbi:hypothetical protein M23134_07257 [Microscilla marina ATCC 23134]|uniref:Uncharacterized protein n=1 Tax=Microscilla marina ATCC 23134 TaxID=313606 RepID=A1ZVA8_MICM2|nr:hypothetical protein M23134_07257 [Microscilla marina ATCC 23134]